MSPLNFVETDFDELVKQLQDIVKDKDTWKDIFSSGTGQMLIELFSFVSEMLMFYIERRAQESYLDTAQLRSSVVNLVKLINYQPKRNVSAVGDVQFTLAAAHTENIFISKFTNLESAAGVPYLTNEEGVISAGTLQVTLEAIQGERITANFTGDGTINQSVLVNDKEVENTEIDVFVDSIKWTSVTSFVRSTGTDQHYKIEAGLDGTITIQFGDGQFGAVPGNTLQIQVQYIRSKGDAGNVFSDTGVVTSIVDTILDALNAPVTDISVNNTSKFLSGDDAESIDEIKFEAPRVFATGDRAVTRADYIAILENQPGVVSANVFGENELNPPDITKFNLVRILLVLANYAFPDTAFKLDLQDFLLTKAQITVHYEFVDPTIIDVVAIDVATVPLDQSLSAVDAAIKAVLDAQFLLGTVTIASPIRFSDVSRAIDEIVGVDFHTLRLRIRQTLGTGDGSTNLYTGTLFLTPTEDFVQVFQDTTLVAEDDGLGNLTEVAGSGVTGTINYVTRVISVTFSIAPPLTTTVFARYKMNPGDGSDDLIVARDMILRLVTKEITVGFVS